MLRTSLYTSPDGLLASVADATHPATTYAYNGLDQLKTTTYPDSTTETYAYDADGNVVTRTTRKGDMASNASTFSKANFLPYGEIAGEKLFGGTTSGATGWKPANMTE